MQKYLSFIMYYGSALLCLHINYIVYKHFDRSLHVASLNHTCVQNFTAVSLTIFEIQTEEQEQRQEELEK